MPEQRRACAQCGRGRAERFYTSARARICASCLKANRRSGARRRHVEVTYGLTQEDHDRLLAYQDGRCAITGKKMPYNLAVDHSHESGMVRGLLSKAANKLLRDVRDDPAVLRAAIAYLEDPPAARLGIVAQAPTAKRETT